MAEDFGFIEGDEDVCRHYPAVKAVFRGSPPLPARHHP
jgi:hypothetical protein